MEKDTRKLGLQNYWKSTTILITARRRCSLALVTQQDSSVATTFINGMKRIETGAFDIQKRTCIRTYCGRNGGFVWPPWASHCIEIFIFNSYNPRDTTRERWNAEGTGRILEFPCGRVPWDLQCLLRYSFSLIYPVDVWLFGRFSVQCKEVERH
jgi:hypothetical protein